MSEEGQITTFDEWWESHLKICNPSVEIGEIHEILARSAWEASLDVAGYSDVEEEHMLLKKLKDDLDVLYSFTLVTRREQAQNKQDKQDKSKRERQAAHGLIRMIFEGSDELRYRFGECNIASYFEAEQEVRELREKISDLETDLRHSNTMGMR